MDGVETYTNVFILGATNRLELLDEAILRPGRFDYALEVKRPSPEGCRKILGIHTHRMPLGAGVDLDAIAAELEGRTGAEIAYVTREAAYNCLAAARPNRRPGRGRRSRGRLLGLRGL